jgi:hypothetical protein
MSFLLCRFHSGYLQELPGNLYQLKCTEMAISGTRNPGGILENQQTVPGFLVVPQK